MSFSAEEKVDGTNLVRAAYDFKSSNEKNKKEGIEISEVGELDKNLVSWGWDRVEGRKHTIYHIIKIKNG